VIQSVLIFAPNSGRPRTALQTPAAVTLPTEPFATVNTSCTIERVRDTAGWPLRDSLVGCNCCADPRGPAATLAAAAL